jgi:LysR family glycine cleavage system transcriptional activator
MSKLRFLVPSTHSLFVFEAAARNLNFKKAAGELNVTQPSVSHAIKALEKHCKVTLFVRDNRGVHLTEAGRVLYEDVRTGFMRIEQSLESISTRGTKYITFAASTSLAAHWLAPQLYHFQKEHPDIRIRVVATERDIEPDHDIDMTVWLRKRSFQRDNCWYICDEVVFPVCSQAYLSAHARVKGVDDLVHHELIQATDAFRKRMNWTEWVSAAGGDASRIVPNIAFNDLQLSLQAALAGEGIALGWNLTTQLLLGNKLLIRPLKDEVRTDQAFFLLAGDNIAQSRKRKTIVDWFLSQTKDLRRSA